CLLASVAAHALAVAMVLALPALAQPEVADEERVSVEVITPQELQEIIEEARLEQLEQPDPELDPSVLEPPPEPVVNTKDEADADTEAAPADAPKADAEPQPETDDEKLTEQTTPDTPEPEKSEPLKPRPVPAGPATIGPKSDAEPGQRVQKAPTIPAPGRPIVIPRKRVVPEEEKVVVGDRKRETLCHDAAKSEVTKSRPELKPDVVISSAIVPSEAAANIIVANGAAFRSEGRWYNFKFRCEADPFEEKLIAFDFLIGPAFPEGEVVEVKVSEEN
ncbi:MAG: DUF930 domain-containing protein, partial [Hyphomicrobiales bacterium]